MKSKKKKKIKKKIDQYLDPVREKENKQKRNK